MSGRYPREGDWDEGEQRGVWDSDAPLPGEQYRDDPYGSRSGPNRVPPGGQYPAGRDPRMSGPERVQRGTGRYPQHPGRDSAGPGRDSGGRDGRQPAGNRDRRAQAGAGTGPYPRDPRGGGYPVTQPRYEDARSRDPRAGDPRYSDPRYSDARYSDARYRDPRNDDPRNDDPRYGDPRRDDRYRDARRGGNRYDNDPQWEGDGILPGLDRRERGYPGRGDERFYREASHGDGRYADGGHGDGGYPGEEDEQGAKGRSGKGKQRRRKGRARRLAPWIALIVILIILIPVAGGGWYAYRYLQAKNHPPDFTGPGSGPPVMVQVASGDTATSLGLKLYELGVVKSQRAFVLAAENSTSTATLEAGFFRINHDMQASLAYAYLLNPKNMVKDTVTLPEGLRWSDTLIRLGKASGIPLADYQAAIKQVTKLGLPPYAGGKPEGYLFPSQYIIQPKATALSVLQQMVARFNDHAALDNLPTAANLPASGGTVHLTAAQVITVASLIQAEGGRPQDFPEIAEVIYNRLKSGMKLQLDSTVFYGLGTYGTRATAAQYNRPTPYNTYTNTGLPVGPIDSPGDAAIKAALHPATGKLLYFFGCSNGTTKFSATHALSSC